MNIYTYSKVVREAVKSSATNLRFAAVQNQKKKGQSEGTYDLSPFALLKDQKHTALVLDVRSMFWRETGLWLFHIYSVCMHC